MTQAGSPTTKTSARGNGHDKHTARTHRPMAYLARSSASSLAMLSHHDSSSHRGAAGAQVGPCAAGQGAGHAPRVGGAAAARGPGSDAHSAGPDTGGSTIARSGRLRRWDQLIAAHANLVARAGELWCREKSTRPRSDSSPHCAPPPRGSLAAAPARPRPRRGQPPCPSHPDPRRRPTRSTRRPKRARPSPRPPRPPPAPTPRAAPPSAARAPENGTMSCR